MYSLTKTRPSLRYLTALLLALMVASALSLLTAAPAFAKTYDEAWTVEFTGTEMKDEGTANITKTLGSMQPGDSARFTIEMKEGSQGSADWYMRNKVLTTMEESMANANERSGGSYSYKLTYITPKNEEKVILTNEVVSGEVEGDGTKTRGLFDATEATGEWFYLDTLAADARAYMVLEVAIDGETHGNTYFDTDASVQLAFAAEPSDEEGTKGEADPPSGDPKDDPKQKNSPKSGDTKKSGGKLSQTGDMLPLGIIVAVAVVAAGVVVVAAVRSRKRNDKEGDAR